MQDNRYGLQSLIVGVDKSFIQANVKELKKRSLGVYIVPPMHVRRLDLISQLIYGTVDLKYLLIYVNDIVDISVVGHGYRLRYPEIRDILKVLNETAEVL